MESYFYKTKQLTVFFPMAPVALVKNEGELYTSLSIINNSDVDIIVIEKEEGNLDVTKGTLLGAKKMLTYENTPKNSVFIFSNSGTPVDILVKYSE